MKKFKIVKKLVKKNPCYKAYERFTPQGAMLHGVGCPQPKAPVFVKNFNNPSTRVCVHAFIDARNGKTYQILPWKIKAWHCGAGSKGSGNNIYIGIEMCEPKYIKYTGGSSFKVTNRKKAIKQAKKAYEGAVYRFAVLCNKFDWNPMEDGVIISHREGYQMGIASNHGDPEHLWKGLGLDYTMDGFRKDVKSALKKLK